MYQIKSDGIECWARDTEKLFMRSRSFTNDQMRLFMSCLMGEAEFETNLQLKDDLEKGSKLVMPSAFYKRVKGCHTYTASLAVCMCIGGMASSFGEVAIFTNYLQYQAFKHNRKHVDMDFISICFADGFPTKEVLLKVWDSQKVDPAECGDNLLDYTDCQASISFK